VAPYPVSPVVERASASPDHGNNPRFILPFISVPEQNWLDFDFRHCLVFGHLRLCAGVAQLVEHKLPKLGVAGSNPVARSSRRVLLLQEKASLIEVVVRCREGRTRTSISG
jgi:hypothetical protein